MNLVSFWIFSYFREIYYMMLKNWKVYIVIIINFYYFFTIELYYLKFCQANIEYFDLSVWKASNFTKMQNYFVPVHRWSSIPDNCDLHNYHHLECHSRAPGIKSNQSFPNTIPETLVGIAFLPSGTSHILTAPSLSCEMRGNICYSGQPKPS